MTDIDFDARARWAESEEPSISPNAVIHRGTEESRAEALKMLLDAADTPPEREEIKAMGGRPRLDPEGGTL
ncbi:hypothetical protein ABH924_003624 [Arthrobacter sp. GAS37]|uniref:hypothetical protein n=1 Tax=Arthrobacter sp. GAS37 TaxID=3156261 RepID=UPI0038343CC0